MMTIKNAGKSISKFILLGSAALFMTTFSSFADGNGMVKYVVGGSEDAPTIEKSLTGDAGDAVSGKKVFLSRKKGNCLACHTSEHLKDQPFHGEVGPTLDGVTERLSESEIRALLVNSKLKNPDTLMPGFYVSDGLHLVDKKFEGKTILKAQEIEDVIAYLKELK